jgi:Ser/Thr protein kinase RdoA (MazF antagonist)
MFQDLLLFSVRELPHRELELIEAFRALTAMELSRWGKFGEVFVGWNSA